jgi:hypothetical protein
MFKLLLKRLKYKIKNIFAKNIYIPSDFKTFEYNFPNYYKPLLEYLSSNQNIEIDSSIKIFGKKTEKLIFSKDIFNNVDFKFHDKVIPAYFNKGDVKVPYEASRLQFLQKFDLLSILNKFNIQDISLDVNDFPLIYWNSPMDVAIRNINLILHRNFLENNKLNAKILGNNKDLIDTYISQHYQFIINNVENDGNVVGNHYLVELSSILLTIATYKFEESEKEFDFYLNELINQLNLQFYDEGTNFEGSSHYSALATEALLICKLAIEELDFNSLVLETIEKIILANKNFLSLLTINGELSQIGDNDSGRLFYFYFDEDNPLRMNWLFDMINYFYSGKSKTFLPNGSIEDSFSTVDITSYLKEPNLIQSEVEHPPIKVFRNEFDLYSFREFGIYIWRNKEGSEYLSIRCGRLGQNGVGGHSHYDQLSIECFTNGTWYARDPGTGTYTDNIDLRNKFRSADYHWGPKSNIKFPKLDEFDCFKLRINDGEALHHDKYNFLGSAVFEENKIFRTISINDGIVTIKDFSKDCELEAYTSWGEKNYGTKVQFSEGYKRIN